jgi:hypothetical protein
MSVKKLPRKTSECRIKSLCDEIGVAMRSMLLMSQREGSGAQPVGESVNFRTSGDWGINQRGFSINSVKMINFKIILKPLKICLNREWFLIWLSASHGFMPKRTQNIS